MDTNLIKRFVEAYHSAESAIDENDSGQAKEKYRELLKIYNRINDSDLDKMHKELAYEQVNKIFEDIKSIQSKPNFTKHIVITAALILIFSLIIAIKPSIIGLSVFDSNNAPELTYGTNAFEIQGETQLNLDDYFHDKDNEKISYLVTNAPGVIMALRDNILTIKPQKGAYGKKQVLFIASDGKDITKAEIVLNIA